MGGVFNQVAGVLSRNLVAIFIEVSNRPGVGRGFLNTQKITDNSGSEIRINCPDRVGENPGPNRINMDTIQESNSVF